MTVAELMTELAKWPPDFQACVTLHDPAVGYRTVAVVGFEGVDRYEEDNADGEWATINAPGLVLL